MAPDPAAVLAPLLRSSVIQDHDEILKTATAALKASRGDTNLLRTRIVALLKLDRFDDAIRALADGGDGVRKSCVLENAYALYKLGRLEDAEKALKSTDAQSRGVSHLEAQVAYRAERFVDARSAYEKLRQAPTDDSREENDVRINQLATRAQLAWNGSDRLGDPSSPKSTEAQRELDAESFEAVYNTACVSIAQGRLSHASSLLQRASRLCEDSDELSDVERQSELLPILLQQAYVFSRLGMLAEASKIHESVPAPQEGEADCRTLGRLNKLALLANPENPFMAQKDMKDAISAAEGKVLFAYQLGLVRRMELILDLYAQKCSGVESRTSAEIRTASPTISAAANLLSTVNAHAHCRQKSGKAAITDAVELLKKRPLDVGLVLTVVQLCIRGNEPCLALSHLESLLHRLEADGDDKSIRVRFSPGIVALVVSLYRLLGREKLISAELSKAASWQSGLDTPATALLREAGLHLISSQDSEDLELAAKFFERLCKLTSNDPVALAGFVAAGMSSTESKLGLSNKDLPKVKDMIAGTDIGRLIGAGVAHFPPAMSRGEKRSATRNDGEVTARKRRRRKLPTNHGEGRQPDPERWLPLRDRSSYRPKGKKGKKKAMEVTQGGPVKDEEMLELVGGAGAVKVERAPAVAPGKRKKGKR